MKYKVTIVALLISACLLITKRCSSQLTIIPVKSEIWVRNHTVVAGDNFCQVTSRDSGEYVLMQIPTVLFNNSLTEVIHGYPGDGYIEYNPLCPGSSFHIPNFQQFVIRDACTGEVIRISPKSYFAIGDNFRMWYWNANTGRAVRSVNNQVVNDFLAKFPNVDSVALARAPYFTNYTGLPLQYTSGGAGDVYWCGDGQNQLDVTGLNGRHLLIDVIATPTPSSGQPSDTSTFAVYLDPDYHVYTDLPADCPPTCDISNPEPLSITVSGDSVLFPHACCDVSDLEIIVWHEKNNRLPEYRAIETVQITTETFYLHTNKLSYRDLQRAGRNVPWTFSGGSYEYGYKIGNTVYKP